MSDFVRARVRRGRNAIDESEHRTLIVLRFSRQKDGKLECRVTDTLAMQSWMSAQASELLSQVLQGMQTTDQI